MRDDFIGELAKYYNLENDLSNITVALCNSDEFFKEKFMDFFFPGLDVNRIADIQREVPDENGMGSRVDIYIKLTDDKLPYLVEVKIGDQNHHFGQYEEAYKIDRSRLGYITNYYCAEGKTKKYDVKTWEEFYKTLTPLAEKDKLIKSYLSYLKQVCNIIIYDQPMKFSNLNSIPQFIATVKSLLEKNAHPIEIDLKGTSVLAYDYAVLKSFYFKESSQTDNKAFGSIGLWFQEQPLIMIGVSSAGQELRSWLPKAILKERDNFSDAMYCEPPYVDKLWYKDDVWSRMKPEVMQEFLDTDNVERQKELLEDFIDEFLSKVKPLLH